MKAVMMWWTTQRSERHLLALIRCALLNSRGTMVFLHADVTHKANTVERKSKESNLELENAKLDAFVRSIQLRNKKVLSTRQVVRKTGVREDVVLKKTVENTSTAETTESKFSLSEDNCAVSDSIPTRLQYVDIAVRSIVNKDYKLVGSPVKCLNITDAISQNNKENVSLDTKGSLSSRLFNDSESVTSHHLESTSGQITIKLKNSTVTSHLDMEPGVTSLQKSASPGFHQFTKLTKAEQATLTQLMDDGKLLDAVVSVESHDRNNHRIPFGLLRRLCGCSCVLGQVDVIIRMKTIAEKSHQHLYKKEFYLDTYLASALCYSGKFQESLDKITDIYKNSPKGTKKVRDTVKHIIFHIMDTKNKDNEEMVMKFVAQLAKELNVLSPSLSLWRFCFCSDVYRHQKIADNLLENYPALVELLPHKLDNVIRLAYDSGDLDLLHRIFQLLLFHKLSDYYTAATSALLKHQCEIGDLKGANETIKFATVLKVQLKPSDIQRFLAVLHQHNHPAPLSILEMKYRMPPKPSPAAPPSFVYKF